jgi:signal peptidase II
MLITDQLVKWWARTAAQGTEGRSIAAWWPGVFELKLIYNEGVAFGQLQGWGIWLTPVAVGIAVGAALYSFKHKDDPVSVHVTMALLAGGAIGNLIDRVAFGRVTDMFWIRAIDFPVFNVADMCISAAGTLLVLSAIADMFHKKEDTDPEPEPSVADGRKPIAEPREGGE